MVKTNTSTGFNPGDTFFTPQDPGTIGWISSDASRWSNQWLTIFAESNSFRGDIYVDQTAIWGGDLLVVSGESGGLLNQNMNIWRVSTNKQASLVASIPTSHLEGLLTLPTTYYLEPVAQSGNPNTQILASFTYPNGTLYSSGTAQNAQLWFREGIVVPEPSAIALATVGVMGLVTRKHRRR